MEESESMAAPLIFNRNLIASFPRATDARTTVLRSDLFDESRQLCWRPYSMKYDNIKFFEME